MRGLIALFMLLAAFPADAANPDLLWQFIEGQCIPNQVNNLPPKPCASVNLDGGAAHGFVVLKDIEGQNQFLLMPTAHYTGIESPELLAPDATNYFAAAWLERGRMNATAGRVFPREAVSLSVNSISGRSQNQLHVHIDCIDIGTRDALKAMLPGIGAGWAPLPVRLSGHPYLAMRVAGEDLTVNPFKLLADGVPGAASDMGHQTLFVAGVVLPDGGPGFVILADRTNPLAGNFGHSEELQDHTCRGL